MITSLSTFLLHQITVNGIDVTPPDRNLLLFMFMNPSFLLGMNHHWLVIHLFYLQPEITSI